LTKQAVFWQSAPARFKILFLTSKKYLHKFSSVQTENVIKLILQLVF
jgi:hypothetical protein